MELRTLEYFLAVAREGNITNAAKALHVTQPTLSRQLTTLEDEFERQLFIRGRRGTELTEYGILLQNYAENIVGLARKAEEDMKPRSSSISGVVHIGAGETRLMSIVARAMVNVREKYPGITFDLSSGATADLKQDMIKGFFDIMLECEIPDHSKLNVLPIPIPDTWCAVMRTDDVLAKKDVITPKDLADRPLITSRQGMKFGRLGNWFGPLKDDINVVAEYQLPLNMRFLVTQGVGIAIVYEGLIESKDDIAVCRRPLYPTVESYQGIVWRKSMPNPQTQVFLDELHRLCALIETDPKAAAIALQ